MQDTSITFAPDELDFLKEALEAYRDKIYILAKAETVTEIKKELYQLSSKSMIIQNKFKLKY